MTSPLLSIAGLGATSDRDGGAPILRDVSLTLERGEVRGLVGESGAGKSTIAKALLGILPRSVRITSGSILFESRNLLTLSAKELRGIMGSDISLIPQDPQTALNPGRRIEAQLTDGLRLKRGMSSGDARRRALKLLEEVHIRDPERVLSAYPHELSGGMRQRILIAAAFALEPKLVVADEPTTALDVTIQAQILSEVQKLARQHGTALIWITHDLSVVAGLADDVAVMYSGRIVEQGKVSDVLDRPLHPYTQGLIGSLPGNNRRGERLRQIPGLTPNLLHLPPTCAFAARCERVSEQCLTRPEITEPLKAHFVRCFHPALPVNAVELRHG